MNEKLPEVHKENIFSKIFNKIKSFFLKNEEKTSENNVMEYNEESTFFQELKIEPNLDNKEFKRKKLMKDLIDNPNLLENFSIDRLEKILEWYLKDNEKKRIRLKKING